MGEAERKTWAKCTACGKEMAPGNGCTVHTYNMPTGIQADRIPWGSEHHYPPPQEGKACHDCNATPGQYHHIGCDMEECPKCHGQLLMCDCWD